MIPCAFLGCIMCLRLFFGFIFSFVFIFGMRWLCFLNFTIYHIPLDTQSISSSVNNLIICTDRVCFTISFFQPQIGSLSVTFFFQVRMMRRWFVSNWNLLELLLKKLLRYLILTMSKILISSSLLFLPAQASLFYLTMTPLSVVFHTTSAIIHEVTSGCPNDISWLWPHLRRDPLVGKVYVSFGSRTGPNRVLYWLWTSKSWTICVYSLRNNGRVQ